MELRDKISEIRKLVTPGNPVGKNEALLNLKVGSGINVLGTPYVVVDVYDYQELSKKGKSKNFFWKEYRLYNLVTFEEHYLEVEDDDAVEVYLTGERVASGRFSENPSIDVSSVKVAGFESASPFYLDDTCYAIFKDGKGKEENVTMLDYEGDDSKTFIGVEIWEDGNARAYQYTQIKLKDLEVFAHE